MDIRVVVAMHKPHWLPSDDVYLPVHAGKARSDYDLGIVGDDTGRNISHKNSLYCELTALYWAWKNLKHDYIGLCHYRRYFAKPLNQSFKMQRQRILKRADFERILTNADVILPKKRKYYIESVGSHFIHAHGDRALALARHVLRRNYPDYVDDFNAVIKDQTKLFPCNMFVMRRERFDEYCSWLFDVLGEVERAIKPEHESGRIYGFLAERLLNVWVRHNRGHLSIEKCEIVFFGRVNWTKKGAGFLKRKFSGQITGFFT